MTIEPNCRGRARRQMSRPRDDRLTWSLSFFVVLAGLFVVALTIEPFLPQRHRGRGGWTVLGMVSVTAAIVFGAFAYDMVASDWRWGHRDRIFPVLATATLVWFFVSACAALCAGAARVIASLIRDRAKR